MWRGERSSAPGSRSRQGSEQVSAAEWAGVLKGSRRHGNGVADGDMRMYHAVQRHPAITRALGQRWVRPGVRPASGQHLWWSSVLGRGVGSGRLANAPATDALLRQCSAAAATAAGAAPSELSSAAQGLTSAFSMAAPIMSSSLRWSAARCGPGRDGSRGVRTTWLQVLRLHTRHRDSRLCVLPAVTTTPTTAHGLAAACAAVCRFPLPCTAPHLLAPPEKFSMPSCSFSTAILRGNKHKSGIAARVGSPAKQATAGQQLPFDAPAAGVQVPAGSRCTCRDSMPHCDSGPSPAPSAHWSSLWAA